MPVSEQHDDHCWVKANGRMMFIRKIKDGIWYLQRGSKAEVWDMRKLNHARYASHAVFMMRVMEPVEGTRVT